MKLFSVIALAALFGSAATSLADCKDGLRPDIVSATLDTSTALTFLWFASEDEFNQRKAKGNGSLGIPEVLEVEFGNESDTQTRRSKMEKLGYTLDETKSLTYFASTLPSGVREEFFKCEQLEGGNKPFFLTWSQSGMTQNGAIRTIKIELKRISIQGQPPEEFSLKWVSSSSELQDRLNSLFKKLRTASASLPTSFELGLDESVSVEVYRVDKDKVILTGVSTFIPPTPKIVVDDVIIWKKEIFSIPLVAVTHRAHIGNKASTINYNPDITFESDSGNLLPDSLPASNNQEITLGFDLRARAKLPELSQEELGFEYRCGFVGPVGFKITTVFYPSENGWQQAGTKCGKQTGSILGEEPVMSRLAYRLTGSQKNLFKAKLSCRIGNDWVQVVPESGCVAPNGLTDIRMEIDSIGPG